MDDKNADLVSELEQDRFFHCTVFEEDKDKVEESSPDVPAQQASQDTEEIAETTLSDPIVPDNLPLLEEELNIPAPIIKKSEVNYTAWADKVLMEQAANIYVVPGQEAFVDTAALIAEKAQREADGLFVGDEPILSSNLQARLMRDNWLVNSNVPHLKDLVYSYPVRSWKVLNHSAEFDNLMKPENVAKSVDPFEEAPAIVGDDTPCYELCVNLTELRFLSHTLMSEEHKIEMNLIKKFENYVSAVKRHESSKVAESLQEYRYNWQMKRHQNLQFQGLQDSPSRNTVSSDLKTVIELRGTLYLERFRIKAAMVEVLEEWDRLVSIREMQRYNSTRSKLIIYSTQAPEKDSEIWNRDIDDELEEELARFQDRMRQYEHEMAEYRRHKSEARNNSGGDAEESDNSERKKPKKPAPFNEPTEREKIEQRNRESRRGPGQPVQSLDLDIQGSLLESPDSMVDKAEKTRRENARKARYILKYQFNSKEFFVSDKLGLDTQFRLPAQDPLRVRTAEIPKSLKCQIYESGLISNTYIGEVIFQIPTSSVTANYPSENVSIFDNNPMIGGRVVYLSWWGKDPETGALLVPTQLPSVFTQSHRQRDIYDPGFNLEEQSAIDDPNDPDFVPVGNPTGGQTFSGFVLNPFLSEGFFAPSEALESSKRLRVLKLRADDVTEFMGRKMIPLRDHEIKDSEIQSYEDRIMGEMDQDTSGLDHRNGSITILKKFLKPHVIEPNQREIIQRQRNRTRALVMERLRACNRILSYSDVIREDPLPELGQLIGNFGKFFEARRPLRPDRRDRAKAPTGGLDQVPKIIVSIRSANNLPVREQIIDEEVMLVI
jgi:hypothetical protein